MNNSTNSVSVGVDATRRHMVIGLCLLGIIGCGPGNRATVSGKVTMNGQALPDGVVTFRPQPNTPGPEFSGMIDHGAYVVAKDVLPGDYLVEVRAWTKTGRIVKSPFGTDTEEIINPIPPRYYGPTSELLAQLKVGKNSCDFELKP